MPHFKIKIFDQIILVKRKYNTNPLNIFSKGSINICACLLESSMFTLTLLYDVGHRLPAR